MRGSIMDPGYSWRRLDATDAAAYRALRLEGLASAPTAFGSSFDDEAGQPLPWFADRLAHQAVFGGWAADGVLSGVAGLRFSDGVKTRHKGLLWGMYVQPSARGTGLAAALVEAVIAHGRGRVEEIRLAVVADNAPAVRLYTRLGFRPYGVEPRSLKLDGRYYDEMLMALTLPPRA